jgi:hypothetical protein
VAGAAGYLSPELHETFLPHDAGMQPVRRTTYLRPTVFLGADGREQAAKDWAAQVPKVVVAAGAVRAALYRALALIPGISIAAGTAVLDGATGTAFTLAVFSGANRREIVIAPRGGQYLGERLITSRGFGAIPAGTAMESTAVTLAVVDRAPAPPR